MIDLGLGYWPQLVFDIFCIIGLLYLGLFVLMAIAYSFDGEETRRQRRQYCDDHEEI